MAGDWLKWVKGLTRRDEVVRIAMLLKRDRRYVASLCMEFWEWVDESTVDGFLPSATVEQVDIVVDLGGFGEALASVGWIVADADGIHVTNFDRHNGESAKARALAALRKARQRKDTPERDKCHATTVTNVTLDAGQMSRTQRDKSVTREEKRREEKSKEGFTELLVTENPKHNQSGSIAPQRAKPRRDAAPRITWGPEGFSNIREEMLAAWNAAYPACDIQMELAKANAWLVANPKRVKSDYGRFLTAWLSRAQDRGGSQPYVKGNAVPQDIPF